MSDDNDPPLNISKKIHLALALKYMLGELVDAYKNTIGGGTLYPIEEENERLGECNERVSEIEECVFNHLKNLKKFRV